MVELTTHITSIIITPKAGVEKVIIIFQIWKMIEVLLILILPFLPLLESYRVERSSMFCQESFLEMSMSTKNRAIVNDFLKRQLFFYFQKTIYTKKPRPSHRRGTVNFRGLISDDKPAPKVRPRIEPSVLQLIS